MTLVLPINTILYTQDGRKIGNAIVIGRIDSKYNIKTDYGNDVVMSLVDIFTLFHTDNPNNDDVQKEYLEKTHKHAVK